MALREKLREVISIQDSPRKLALSFAIGVFIGMSPILGLHTVLGIMAAWAFRLNRFVTVIGVYITNPWTIVPIYSFSTWAGARLLGTGLVIPALRWESLSCTYFLNEMRHLLWPFVLGTTLVGTVAALIGYFIIYHAVMRNRSE